MWDEQPEEYEPAESVTPVPAGPDGAAHFYFPVHVVVVGDIGEEAKCEIEDRIWEKLHRALG